MGKKLKKKSKGFIETANLAGSWLEPSKLKIEGNLFFVGKSAFTDACKSSK